MEGSLSEQAEDGEVVEQQPKDLVELGKRVEQIVDEHIQVADQRLGFVGDLAGSGEH